jgi:hypothetical protein
MLWRTTDNFWIREKEETEGRVCSGSRVWLKKEKGKSIGRGACMNKCLEAKSTYVEACSSTVC